MCWAEDLPEQRANAVPRDDRNDDVAGIIRVPHVILANPSLPAKTVLEFIDYAKVHPGKINMASGGNGSSGHMAGELLSVMAGVKMAHIPYRGQGPAFSDLLGGQVRSCLLPRPARLTISELASFAPLP